MLRLLLVLLFISSISVGRVNSHQESGEWSCESDSEIQLQAEFKAGLITLDGHADDWKDIDGFEFSLLPALDPDADKEYKGGKMTVKALHDGHDVFFLLQVDGDYVYSKGNGNKCPSVALMFQIGESASYHNMGGCTEGKGNLHQQELSSLSQSCNFFQQWMAIAIACASFIHVFFPVESHPIADKISSLPGQPPVSFQQFAGYITIDEKQQRALFYYFVEAETNPDSKPLVLWLNGGPGCSSIGAGAFIEHGPFRPSEDNLVKNEYSWNKEANILYLESPAGVGFSYSTNKSFYRNVNDEITARDNLEFLRRWFVKFPEYQNRDLFVAGESYAGHYVPQLAQLIVQSKVKFRLKGIAIGNPLLEFSTDFNSADAYHWSHGLISDASYALITSVCNNSQLQREAISGIFSAACVRVNGQIVKELTDSIDPYNVIGDTCLSSSQSQMDILSHPLRSRFQLLASLRSQSQALNQQQVREKGDACAQEKTFKYLNRKDVQKALHAKLIGDAQWNLCNNGRVLQYDLKNLEIPTIGVVGSLVKSGIPVIIYSGDQDSVIPFTGTRTLVNQLSKELGLKVTVPYRAWFEKKQVGGWTQVYGNILSFASIRGASHTAPNSQPERSLVLFKAFLRGSPLPEA